MRRRAGGRRGGGGGYGGGYGGGGGYKAAGAYGGGAGYGGGGGGYGAPAPAPPVVNNNNINVNKTTTTNVQQSRGGGAALPFIAGAAIGATAARRRGARAAAAGAPPMAPPQAPPAAAAAAAAPVYIPPLPPSNFLLVTVSYGSDLKNVKSLNIFKQSPYVSATLTFRDGTASRRADRRTGSHKRAGAHPSFEGRANELSFPLPATLALADVRLVLEVKHQASFGSDKFIGTSGATDLPNVCGKGPIRLDLNTGGFLETEFRFVGQDGGAVAFENPPAPPAQMDTEIPTVTAVAQPPVAVIVGETVPKAAAAAEGAQAAPVAV